MKAIEAKGDSLEWRSASLPPLKASEVTVRIQAVGVNRADLLQRRGKYPPPAGASPLLGLECSGVVTETHKSATLFKEGDRVFALTAGGAYATHTNIHEALLTRMPSDWDFPYAAAIPEAFYTAYLNLLMEGGLKSGEVVLIHAGGSGVGLSALQIAKAFNHFVITTAGRDDKLNRCQELSADVTLNYRDQNFIEKLNEVARAQGGIDVILDPVGKTSFSQNLQIMNHRGRLILIGLMSGYESTIDLNLVLRKNLRIIGSTLRNKSIEEKSSIKEEFDKDILPLLLEGKVRPIIDTIFPIEQAELAHARMQANENIGKIILTVSE